ncbi:MAG TPA: hypothetical protein PKE31_12345 [Pseudomonadota bacterium]|nr:hypothetical protein [Pseudomonadota bacterium]
MGGGHYDEDIALEARSSNRDVFTYRGYGSAQEATAHRGVHPILNPFGKIRECMNETPIVVAMDVTRSRGDDTKIIYDKLPMFMGQIEMRNYVPSPAISFAAIGDANSDQAPLQVGQFEADNRLDEVLSKMWIEEGGGGTGQESYELAAFFYARQTKLECLNQGRKGYFFFLGDEGFYPQVSANHIRRVLGQEAETDIDSAAIFEELKQKFHVFFIYPQKSMAERQNDIDAEIKKRVEAAGGVYEGVDVRASLIWDNRNDLDLHVIAPSGEHIFYGHKQSQCKGELDVDRNVRGETTKPVENIRWKKGEAPAGRYQVFVQNYRFHEPDAAPTPFRVELEVNGKIQHIEGVISGKRETGKNSDITVAEFEYDPRQRPAEKKQSTSENPLYANYQDDVIIRQWSNVISAEHVLRIMDPKSIIDVMLGALAMVGGGRDLDGYLQDMSEREQHDLRRDQALATLGGLASSLNRASSEVSGSIPRSGASTAASRRSRRL